MSDESVETAGKPRGGLLKYILFFVVGILLVGAGFGGGYYMYALDQKSPADEIDLIIEQKLRESGQLPSGEPGSISGNAGATKVAPGSDNQYMTTYFEFPEKFTTNLRDSEKFLQLGLSISTQYDSSVIENVKIHSQALRSEVFVCHWWFCSYGYSNQIGSRYFNEGYNGSNKCTADIARRVWRH